MDTALITGMFETQFLPGKAAEMDVKNGNTNSFSEIFKSSLNTKAVFEEKSSMKNEKIDENVEEIQSNEDVEEIQLNEDVEEKDVENLEEKSNNNIDIDESLLDNRKEDVEDDGKIKKKESKIKTKDVFNQVSIENKEVEIQDVELGKNSKEKIELSAEDKLNDLLGKLEVEFNTNVKIKDGSENVIKVGPRLVETEKIELNIEEVESYMEVENTNKEVDLFVVPENNENTGLNQNEKDVVSLKYLEENKVKNKDVEKNEDIKIGKEVENLEDENLIQIDVDNNELFNKDDSREKESNEKEGKYKIKDFRSKKDLDITNKVIKDEDVQIQNKFEIKEVNNIRKFENIMEVEQADILEQVTENIEVSLFDSKSEMVIKLKPHDLGNVTVKISIENGVMNAKFLADSIKVKETLESNMSNLKESLKDQGINVQDLSVSVDSGRSQNQTFEQRRMFFNNKRDYRIDKVGSYEDTYYEFSNNAEASSISNYWYDSTVSFLA